MTSYFFKENKKKKVKHVFSFKFMHHFIFEKKNPKTKNQVKIKVFPSIKYGD